RAGLSFSQALEKREKVFTHLGVKVVETTEASGEMEIGLLKISTHIEFWNEISKKVMSALAYPCIVLFMALGVGSFLVVKIIPKFDEYMQKRGILMPWCTALVIHISRVFSDYWLLLIVALFASATAFLLTYRNSNGRQLIEKIAMKVPIMGNVFRYACLTNFASTMAVLLKSGLGLIESLQLTSELLGISVYKNAVKSSADQIIQGTSFKNSLQTPLFPRMVTNIVSIGEETGELNTVLDELGDFYSNELKRTVELVVTAIEPTMMICVGGVVAVVYFALFQAVISLMGG
ncbi:MAG: type II secretion system F family protein, partial [Lentisphaeraceae bacterium]|nr:type II secretion system F family protein [Lentisphaeraceae bacterium]